VQTCNSRERSAGLKPFFLSVIVFQMPATRLLLSWMLWSELYSTISVHTEAGGGPAGIGGSTRHGLNASTTNNQAHVEESLH
jgi:hypothetical protein